MPTFADRRPVHMTPEAGVSRSLCGQGSNQNPATPSVWAPFAAMHVAGCARHICPACLHVWVRS